MSVPKAKKSFVTDLTVIPDKWDSYPVVEHSHLKSCQFKNLNSFTQIHHSRLNQVTVESESGHTRIERCDIKNSSISDTNVERCRLKDCTLATVSNMERVHATGTRFIRPGNIERSTFEDSDVLGKSSVERARVKGSVVALSSTIKRSTLKMVSMTKAQVERSTLSNCDVTECKISGSSFSGMTMKFGIWKNNDLVGRTCDQEVVMMPRTEMQPSSPHEMMDSIRSQIEETPAACEETPSKNSEEILTTPAASDYFHETGLVDEFQHDTYDGPNLGNPPPYEP